MNELATLPQAADPARELVNAMRKLTPIQRRFLKALPQNRGQFWGTLTKLGHGSATGHRWMRNPAFSKARELIEQRALDEIGVTHGYVLGTTKDLVERCMDPEDLREQGALRGLELLGKYRRMWGDEAPKAQSPDGPGMTVIVHQGDNRVAVQAAPGAQGRVVVSLPEPE